MQKNEHGGRVFKYSPDNNKILDFSSNINPLFPTSKIKRLVRRNLHKIKYYPDPQSTVLKSKISKQYGIDKKNIIVGNGSAQLIYLFANLIKGQKVYIAEPNFSEYEISLINNQSEIIHIESGSKENFKIPVYKFEKVLKEKGVLYISNPNNPSGYLYKKEELEQIINICKKKEILLFLDEAFIEFVNDEQAYSLITKSGEYPNLIILRSFTKIYSIPGVRVGFLTAVPEIINKINSTQPPWSINFLAQVLAEELLINNKFKLNTVNYINKARNNLYNSLDQLSSLRYLKSEVNYILCKLNNGITAEELQKRLLKNSILIRDCSNYFGLDPTWFRIAIKDRKSNQKLIKILTKELGK